MTGRGGSRPGAGRKIGSTTGGTGYKSGRIVISCTKEQEQRIKEMAAAQNATVSALILNALKV